MKQKKYLGRRIFALTLALLLSLNTATAYAAPDVPAVSESAENVSVSAEPSGNQEEPKAAEETGDTGNNTEAEEESKENGSEDIAEEGKDPNGQNTAGAPAGGTEVTDPAAGGDGSVVSGADTPSEDELPEEETEVEAEPETEPEAVPGEMPEEVKAFLDAAAALPSADEVTAENAEEVGEQVNAAFDLYDVLVDLGYGEREDVAEAIEKINAVFEAVLAAENVEDGVIYAINFNRTINAGTVTKYVGENGFYQRLPRLTAICPRCGAVLTEYIPGRDEYYSDSYEQHDDEFLNISETDIYVGNYKGGAESGDDVYKGYPCFEVDYTVIKPGESSVKAVPYYSFNRPYESGYCDTRGCNYYASIPSNYDTYYDNITFKVKGVTDYTVVYSGEGVTTNTQKVGTAIASVSHSFTAVSAPTREGYTFKGWQYSGNGQIYEANATVPMTWETSDGRNVKETMTAVWEENDPTTKYTVTYKDGVPGKIVFPDQSYEDLKEGDKTPEFESGNSSGVPKRDGYTFTGWAPAVNPVVSADDADENGEIIYTATWKKNGAPLEDLTVTKTPSEKYPVVGKDFIYTIKVENKNSEAVSVKITDKLNEKLDFVSASDGGKYDEKDRTVTWENISVPANGYKEVTLRVKANAAGTIYNEAEAEWESGSASGNTTVAAKEPEPDPDPANIVYVAGEGGTQDGKNKSVKAGSADISAKAAADDGYYFVNWTAAAEGDDDFEFAPRDKEQLTGTINAVSGATYTFTANFTPKKVLNIEITGKTKTVVYNGKEQSVTGYDMVVKDKEGEKISLPNGLTVIPASDNCEAKGTDARDEAYPMGLNADDFKLTGDGAEKYTVTFTVTDGWLKIVEKKKLAVTAGNVDTVYDGKEHPVTPVVTVGETVKTDDAEITIVYVDKDGNESEKAPVDAGTYTAKVTAKLDGYEDATCEATVTIAKRKLTVTTGSASKTYDGTPLTNSTAAVAVEGGAVDGEEITATATGSRTEVGSAVNTYRLNWGNAKESNYEIAGETLGTLTVNTAGGGGGGNNDDDDDDDDPDPTPTPTPPAPTPTPIIPGPVPTVGPVPVVPTVTPVAPTTTAPTPTVALVSPTPEAVALADEAVPLAAEDEKQPEPVEINEEGTPLAGGKGASWALINFALMNLAIFESLMLLIGYFVNTKNDKEDEEEKRKLKKKGIFRIISIPIAIISLIAFILTEDITLPTAFVDKYTIVMLIIAIVQTVVVALSNKKYEDEEEA